MSGGLVTGAGVAAGVSDGLVTGDGMATGGPVRVAAATGGDAGIVGSAVYGPGDEIRHNLLDDEGWEEVTRKGRETKKPISRREVEEDAEHEAWFDSMVAQHEADMIEIYQAGTGITDDKKN